MEKQWSWIKGGLALGAVFLIAVWLVKPIGVSTQFVIFDGIVWNIFSDDLIKENKNAKEGYSSTNPYLDKSGGKYAKNIANPLNYSFIFVVSMLLGGVLSALLQKLKLSEKNRVAPEVWRNRFGNEPAKRYLYAFIGGVLVLYGARLAGGCTSGHMMSGMMQSSLSGYLFALCVFIVSIPVAMFLYKTPRN